MARIHSLLVAMLALAVGWASPSVAQADLPWVTVTGGGKADFDPGEELEGFGTVFSVSALVSDIPVDNECDAALDGLGVGDFTVTDGEGFTAAMGRFNCSLHIPGEGLVVILGDVLQGRVNEDGSVTLCGLADIPIDSFSGETFVDCPFAVTMRDGPDGFTYYDFITGPDGDSETVVSGSIKISILD